MSVFIDISAALDGQLNTMASLPPVAWENTTYEPVVGTLYLRPTNLQGATVQSSLGTSGTDETIGIYQVDIFAPAGKGKNAAVVMADNIANHFKRGTRLSYNSRIVTVTSAQRGGSLNADGWFMLSVEIIYRSFTEARA